MDGQTDPHRQLFSFPIHFCCIRLFQHVGGKKRALTCRFVTRRCVFTSVTHWKPSGPLSLDRFTSSTEWSFPSATELKCSAAKSFFVVDFNFRFLCPCGFCSFMIAFFPSTNSYWSIRHASELIDASIMRGSSSGATGFGHLFLFDQITWTCCWVCRVSTLKSNTER